MTDLFKRRSRFPLCECAPLQGGGASSQQDSESELGGFLDELISKGIPGVSVAIATGDGVVWTGVDGLADLETRAPVQPDMLFGIGSITKVFVAVAVLQLVEEGRLDLDDTPANLLGDAVKGIPNSEKVTIAQLLNHTGGVPSWEDDFAWIRDGRGASLNVDHIWEKTATLPYIREHTPLAAPGRQFGYANTNFTLLGMILEKVTGKDAVDELRSRILSPLGLSDIYVEGFEPVPESRLPHRYHWATPEFKTTAGVNAAFPEVRPGLIDASRSNLSVEWIAGGMVATARDLVRFGVALRDGRLLAPQSMAFMTDWFPIAEGMQIGHNLYRFELSGDTAIITHSGGVLGFTAILYWVEDRDVAVAILYNVGSVHSGKIPGTIEVARILEFTEYAGKKVLSQ